MAKCRRDGCPTSAKPNSHLCWAHSASENSAVALLEAKVVEQDALIKKLESEVYNADNHTVSQIALATDAASQKIAALEARAAAAEGRLERLREFLVRRRNETNQARKLTDAELAAWDAYQDVLRELDAAEEKP